MTLKMKKRKMNYDEQRKFSNALNSLNLLLSENNADKFNKHELAELRSIQEKMNDNSPMFTVTFNSYVDKIHDYLLVLKINKAKNKF